MPLPGRVVFKDVVELWKKYSSTISTSWPPDDIRHHLSGEVINRIEQLDIILSFVYKDVDYIGGDSEEYKRSAEYMLSCQPKLQSGELTVDKYIAEMPRTIKTREDCIKEIEAYARIRLFTEMFYFVAWRLRQVINSKSPLDFPSLSELKAKSITIVRNNLIEHPEQLGDSAVYNQSLVITDSGPILKSNSALIRVNETLADPNSIDQGLYVNACDLKKELTDILNKAIPAL